MVRIVANLGDLMLVVGWVSAKTIQLLKFRSPEFSSKSSPISLAQWLERWTYVSGTQVRNPPQEFIFTFWIAQPMTNALGFFFKLTEPIVCSGGHPSNLLTFIMSYNFS